jgi:nucleoid DNA-binding protein
MIPNFGKFAKVTILAHEGINPSTGEKVWIETKHKVKFTPSITLKRLMEETTKK